MNLVPMRFSGFTWHHNPKSIKVSCGKTVREMCVPYSLNVIQNLGEKLKVISGTGELYGEDCLEQFNKLQNIYLKGENGILSIPKVASMYACFEKLELLSDSKKNVIIYSFVFREIYTENTFSDTKSYHTVTSGESLWDISYKYDIDIDKLVSLNPQIRFIDELSQGEQVRVC